MNSAAHANNTYAREFEEAARSTPADGRSVDGGSQQGDITLPNSSSRTIPPSPTFRQNRHPFIMGVAGGTASGKTTVSVSWCYAVLQHSKA